MRTRPTPCRSTLCSSCRVWQYIVLIPACILQYIVLILAFVDGTDLHHVLKRRGPLPHEEARTVFVQARPHARTRTPARAPAQARTHAFTRTHARTRTRTDGHARAAKAAAAMSALPSGRRASSRFSGPGAARDDTHTHTQTTPGGGGGG